MGLGGGAQGLTLMGEVYHFNTVAALNEEHFNTYNFYPMNGGLVKDGRNKDKNQIQVHEKWARE